MTKENKIQINSGTLRVPVQVDDRPEVVISFNPSDKLFAERLHNFYHEVKAKLIEMNAKQAALEKEAPEVDENGMPLNIEAVTKDYEEINQWLRERIDLMLGEGVSQKIYGDTVYIGERVDVYIQLFEGLFQIAAPVRSSKMSPYVHRKRKKK